jgi:hypothetical protein
MNYKKEKFTQYLKNKKEIKKGIKKQKYTQY